jgi:hypothetical protein
VTFHTKTISYDVRTKAFFILSVFFVVCLGLYISAVEVTVHNIATRQALQSQSSGLATTVSEMEFQDIAIKNDISIDVAYAHGFKDVTSPTYISRSAAVSLSMNVK